MSSSTVDRKSLVSRNRRMAKAFHATSLKHRIRRVALQIAGSLPIPSAKPGNTQRILLIRPDHLGDVLLTTPTIRALRAALPQAEIHALVGPWSAPALEEFEALDLVLTLPFPGFSRHPENNWRSPYWRAITAARQLRKIGYTSAVVCRPDHWWGALLAYLAGIPERVGYKLPDVAPFLTSRLEHQHEHTVVQSLRLVERWTGPLDPMEAVYDYPIHEADQRYVDSYLDERGIEAGQPVFCIHPGSGTWVKHWQEEKWADVADTLSEQLGATAVFTGGEHELPLVLRITAQMKQPYCVIAGETDIGQLAALFGRAKVVLGPDSGPMHLAAAVGTPTVSLYGPADAAEFGPWGPRKKHYVLTTEIGCRPCRVLDWGNDKPAFHPCVREIPVYRVLDAARRAAHDKGS